ncbi:Six-hairpin glycosidase-like protein [Gloeopeniophorella convolvens]|nr:Six-hairpin glycosidase-like protein [Gloeopeniophorella convolvens]
MYLLHLLTIAAANWVVATAFSPFEPTKHTSAVRSYLEHLIPVLNDVLLRQLTGPEAGADPGVILTLLPDPDHPEWNVYWVRDGCLVYNSWLNELVAHDDKSPHLRQFIDDAVHALVRTQHVTSIAGNIFTGGLEEAAFDVHLGRILNLAARPGSPAADGPPFRAATLTKYADWLLEAEQGNGTWVADVLWPSIELDLQWISLHWNESSWDLWWPPVWGGSFWTASLQHRALHTGARIAHSIGRGENAAEYENRASVILDYLQTFWNEEEGFMTETTVTDVSTGGRSGLGVAPLTVSILNFDPSLGCDSVTFQPCSDRALSSLQVVNDAFWELFPINQRAPAGQPPLLGFYLEEQLFGGHPQHFSTYNAAEQLFDALITWDLLGELAVTDLSLKFFQQFDKGIRTGTYPKGSAAYARLTRAITEHAEMTLVLLARYTPADYVPLMWIDKDTGEPGGPRGVLRNTIAALDVDHAYGGFVPPSWANGGRRVAGRAGNASESQGVEGSLWRDDAAAGFQTRFDAF